MSHLGARHLKVNESLCSSVTVWLCKYSNPKFAHSFVLLPFVNIDDLCHCCCPEWPHEIRYEQVYVLLERSEQDPV